MKQKNSAVKQADRQLLEKATQEEIDFFCNWRYPVCMAETLWHDADNMSIFSEDEFGNIRLYQYPTLSWEWVQDLESIPMKEKEKMKAKKKCSDMYYLGARKIGKSKVALEMDIPLTMQYENNGKSLFSSIDEKHIKNITDPVIKILEKHLWFKIFKPNVTDKQQTLSLEANNYRLKVINMAVKSKDPGDNFYGEHTPRMFIEEFSLEPNVVYNKRKDALSDYGAVMRCVSKGTKILLANGKYEKIENIEEGDFVFALDLKTGQYIPSKVKAVAHTGKKEVIKLKNMKSGVYLTSDHEVLVDFGFGPEWIEVQDCYGTQKIYADYVYTTKHSKAGNVAIENLEIIIDTLDKKESDVYDIETEHQNFIANGFVVHNCSGMTNFIRQSPAGVAFYAKENQNHVINLPQAVNPTWDEEERLKKIEEHGGETTINFKTFCLGEVVESGVSLYDMERVRLCYKKIPYKLIEIDKKKYEMFSGAVENFLHVSRPKKVDEILIALDVGVTGISEILIIGRIIDKYRLLYNIRLDGLKIEEKNKIIQYIAETLEATIIGIDTNEGQGSALADLLEVQYGSKKIFRFKGTFNIETSYERDEKGEIVFKNGQPVYKEERMAKFAVLKLQKLLYDEEFEIPEDDFKFDNQMNQVIATVSKAGNVNYDCVAEENHYFDAWKILAVLVHKLEFLDSSKIKKKPMFLGFNF